MDYQVRQQTAPFGTAEIDKALRPGNLERAKDPKLHRLPLPDTALGKPPTRS
jgi:hypothetical protein